MSTPPRTEAEKREKLIKIIHGIRGAFMVTRAVDGGMHARPMATAEMEPDLVRLWFATSIQSGKIDELSADDRVLCAYSNFTGSEWASIYGRARLVTDFTKIKQLWSPFWKTWFNGPDDPNLTLIEVIPESAEYWDSGSMVLSVVKLAIAAVTGKLDEGENQRLSLQ